MPIKIIRNNNIGVKLHIIMYAVEADKLHSAIVRRYVVNVDGKPLATTIIDVRTNNRIEY